VVFLGFPFLKPFPTDLIVCRVEVAEVVGTSHHSQGFSWVNVFHKAYILVTKIKIQETTKGDYFKKYYTRFSIVEGDRIISTYSPLCM
jgi:hypothetical protein